MRRGAADNKNSENIRDKEYFYKYDTNDIVDNELSKMYAYDNEYKNILTTAPQKSIPSDKIIRNTIVV